MNSILEHAWGVSPAVDRIWAQVSGFIEPERRLLVVLQAAIDDSREGNIIVLAGHVASAEAWAKFAKEWEEILPYSGLKDKYGNSYFKMSEMALSSYGIERSQAFFRIIERHILLSVSCRVDTDVLARARDRVFVPSKSIIWDWLENPYMFATRVLLDGFHQDKAGGLQNYFPIDSNVDFIFDDQAEKKPILAAWDEYWRIETRKPGPTMAQRQDLKTT